MKQRLHSFAVLSLLCTVGCAAQDAAIPTELRSAIPFNGEHADVTAEALSTLWNAQLDTALAVYERSSDNGGNFAYSPASVAIAMAMTTAAATGAALSDIESTLSFPEQAALHDQMAVSLGAMHALNHAGFTAQDGRVVQAQVVNAVNSLWPQEDLAVRPAFLDTLSASYDTGVYPVDYLGNPAGARQQINQWVSDETVRKIPELIPEGIITRDTRLTLVNALYLKGPWLAPFAAANTQQGTFYADVAGVTTPVQTPMMAGEASVSVADLPNAVRVVEIPMGHGDLSFVALMRSCDVNQACEPLASSELPSALAAATGPRTDVFLVLPTFTVRTQSRLKEHFKALGMVAPFEGGLTQIVEGVDMFIQDVIHEAVVAVDEAGVEAAAATAVVIGRDSAPPELRFDQPFWFVIRDNTHRLPLFVGRVADPR